MENINRYLVGVRGDHIVILRPLPREMLKSEALMFAAWIVTMATNDEDEFAEYLKAVQS